MYEDDPQEKVFDLLGEAVFGTPARPRDHRPGVGDRGDLAVGDQAVPLRPLRTTQCRDRGRRRGRPRRVRRAAARSIEEKTGGPAPAAPPGPAPAPPARRFERKDTEQYHVCSAEPAWRATTSAGSRCACSTTCSAAPRRRACSRRSASGAASPTRSTRSRAPTTTPARSGCTSGRGRQRRRGSRVVGAELERVREEPATPDELERAKENLKGRVVLALSRPARG